MDFFGAVERAQHILDEHGRVSGTALARAFEVDASVAAEIAAEVALRSGAKWDGAVLASSTDAEAVADDEALAGGGAERRHLTVLFVDVIDATLLSSEVDAEAWTLAMRTFHVHADACIEKWGGHVGAYMGDGMICFFGYPVTQENAGVRAVRAGLDMVAGLGEVNRQLRAKIGRDLAIRVGCHTGAVVVDEFGGVVQVMGQAANLAARVESKAPRNGVAVSPTTHRLIHGVFDTESLGEFELKGIPGAVELSRVLGLADEPGALGAGRTSAAPLIGRDEELAAMIDRWERARVGEGHVVVVSGEAGIGKSRLVRELRSHLQASGVMWMTASCSAYDTAATLLPVCDLQRRELRLDDADDEGRSLRRALAAAGLDGDPRTPLLEQFHGLRSDDPLPPGDPEQHRIDLLELLTDWVTGLARRSPLVFFVDDLHWADPSTRDLLDRFVERCRTEPMLVLATTRPEGVPNWPKAHVTHLGLERLTDDAVREIAQATAGEDLDDAVLASITARSDGIPFFTEEITNAVVRQVTKDTEIPHALENLLMGRVEQHGLRSLSQAAAVFGREFGIDDLALLVDDAPDAIRTAVERGVTVDVFTRRDAADDRYTFKHALLGDAAYESMVRERQVQLHLRAARGMVEQRPQTAAERPDLVAKHFANADEPAAASPWWENAAETASARAANQEAVGFFRRAIRDAEADADRELRLQLGLAMSLAAAHGHGHPDLQAVWQDAAMLAEATGDRWAQGAASAGSASVLVALGKFEESRKWSQEAADIARELDAGDIKTQGRSGAITMAQFEGRPVQVIEMAETLASRGHRSSERLNRLMSIPLDEWIAAHRAYALGQVARFREAIDVSRALDAASVDLSPSHATFLIAITRAPFAFSGDFETYAEWSWRYYENAQRYDLGYAVGMGGVVATAAQAIVEPTSEHVDRARARVGGVQSGGSLIAAPFLAWMLASAEFACGRPEQAKDTLQFAADLASMTNQRWMDAHIHARQLRVLDALDELPDDWRDLAAAKLTFADERTLVAGGLELATAQADLLAGTDEADAGAEVLASWLDRIRPDDHDAPVVSAASETLSRLR